MRPIVKSRTRVACDLCSKSFRGRFELNRHRVQHSPDKSKLMYKCDWPGCKHGTLQKSNLRTHIENKHLKLQRHKCTIHPINCKRAYSDPASLTRHKKTVHGHLRKESTSDTSSSSSDSESSYDSDFERFLTPSPAVPEMQYPFCSTASFEPMDLMAGINGPQSFDYLDGLPMPEFMQGPSCLPITPDVLMGHQLFYPDPSSCQSFNPDMSLYSDTAFSSTPFELPLEYTTIGARDDWTSLCPELELTLRPPQLYPSVLTNNEIASTPFSGMSEFDQLMNGLGIPQF